MTTTTQSQVMHAIAEGLREAEAEGVIDTQYANTGTIYAVKAGSLDAVGTRLRYDFQNVSIGFTREGESTPAASWSSFGGTAPFVAPTLDELVARVVAALLGET